MKKMIEERNKNIMNSFLAMETENFVKKHPLRCVKKLNCDDSLPSRMITACIKVSMSLHHSEGCSLLASVHLLSATGEANSLLLHEEGTLHGPMEKIDATVPTVNTFGKINLVSFIIHLKVLKVKMFLFAM